MDPQPLTYLEVEERLERYLDPVLSSRRTAEDPARSLSGFSRTQQEFILRWVGVLVRTNSELGFQFAAYAAQAMKLMEPGDVEDWLVSAMDTYDKQGLYPACGELEQVAQYAARVVNDTGVVKLDDVSGVLHLYVQGLSGRKLAVASADRTYTDTETIFVPESISVFPDPERNFGLYKSIVTYLWAQTWFGTFSCKAQVPALSRVVAQAGAMEKAVRMFHALETVRLSACIRSELGMMHRQMFDLQNDLGEITYPAHWGPVIHTLEMLPNDVTVTHDALRELCEESGDVPDPFCFQGELCIDETEQRIEDRHSLEKEQLRSALADAQPGAVIPFNQSSNPESSALRLQTDVEPHQDSAISGSMFNKVIPPANQLRALTDSIIQDFGEIPVDYLVPAGDGEYQHPDDEKRCAQDVWMGTYHEEGAYLYNEWDYRRNRYRKDWCVLRELDVHPQDSRFVSRTLQKYSYLVASMRKSFEALRGQDKLEKKQKHGSDIDIDAVVEAYADNLAGLEASDHLFVKLNRIERDLAAVFMVDMSGSTQGWINDAEREALVLLCESLETLGDRYAIYGFSGATRKRCELYRVKTFEEPYGEPVKQRISGMIPRDYTRMGVTIRHLTWLMRSVDARTRLLITLSDGKPDDYDGYRGEYGIEDTRRALIEAKNEGIHPFCITIDSEAQDYLPHMYGAVNYVLVDEVRKLPLKVSEIYRKLTA